MTATELILAGVAIAAIAGFAIKIRKKYSNKQTNKEKQLSLNFDEYDNYHPD